MNGELEYVHDPRRFRIAWAIFYVIGSLVLLACLYVLAMTIQTHSVPSGQVRLSVPYSRYVVGEPITFTLTNDFNSAIYVTNNCPAEPLSVYRQDSAGIWERLHDQAALGDCPSEDRLIEISAFHSQQGSFAAWHNLFTRPGKYRIVAYVEYYNAMPYQDFEVIAKPSSPAATPATNTTNASTIPTQPSTTTPNGESEIDGFNQ